MSWLIAGVRVFVVVVGSLVCAGLGALLVGVVVGLVGVVS